MPARSAVFALGVAGLLGGCHSDGLSSTQCQDGLKDGMETDVDCGGPRCGPCGQGKQCVIGRDCSTTFCADGYCCNSACGGCSVCNVVDSVGTCTRVANGTDPHNACPGSCSSLCVNGECAAKPSGTVCSGISVCTNQNCNGGFGQCGYTTYNQSLCDGAALECSAPTTTALGCAGYICASATACKFSCAIDSDCLTNHFCDSFGHCTAQLANGSPCVRNEQCTSKVCDSVTAKCVQCSRAGDCLNGFWNCVGGACVTGQNTAASCASAGWGTFSSASDPCSCSVGSTCANSRGPFCDSQNLCVCNTNPALGPPWFPCGQGQICSNRNGNGTCLQNAGMPCLTNSDCASASCFSGDCQPQSAGQLCQYNSDCVGALTCLNGVCM